MTNGKEISEKFQGICSFCRKHWHNVGPMADGPKGVRICYQCVEACKGRIEEECRRIGVDPTGGLNPN
jgi:hypothetical protein